MKALGESGLYKERDSVITEYFIEGFDGFGNQAWAVLTLLWAQFITNPPNAPPRYDHLNAMTDIGYGTVTMSRVRHIMGWEF